MTDFHEMVEVISSWPNKPVQEGKCVVDIHERLRRTLSEYQRYPEAAGQGDLAGLIRHALYREHLLCPAAPPSLRIPRCLLELDEDLVWSMGLKVLVSDSSSAIVEARPWHPSWLISHDEEDPAVPAFLEIPRRHRTSVPIDPALSEASQGRLTTYLSAAQRDIIRSVLCAQEGSTLAINLPTGSGKSLAAWAPALLNQGRASMVLVVVPTTSLAIDQERQLKTLFPERLNEDRQLSWFHGLSDGDRIKIKNAIRQGSQPILFTSPESVMGPLSRPLYEAAREGYLKYFVIDEAHMVGEWGNEFRPHFQAIAGLRNDLLRQCPKGRHFKTLLMSATLTSEALATLNVFFGDEEKIPLLSSSSLRPELSYWFSYADCIEERQQRLMEAIRFLPRPMLIYVSIKAALYGTKDSVLQLLRDLGIRRCRLVSGDTPNDEREDIIDMWRCGDLDIVAATSAFGLGMDQSNVRSVVHACVPETLDRYYQEVGRGGRDGNTCIALAIYTSSDIEDARLLNRKRLISCELGQERWHKMHLKAQRSQSTLVDLREVRADILADSQCNEAWNERTLILMARAGLIRLDGHPPPSFDPLREETSQQFEERIRLIQEEYQNTRALIIKEPNHLDLSFWLERVQPVRQQILRNDQNNLDKLLELFSGKAEAGDLFSRFYSDPDEGLWTTPCCGGCPVCRSQGNIAAIPQELPPMTLFQVATWVSDELKNALHTTRNGFAVVTFPNPLRHGQSIEDWREDFIFKLEKFVAHGIRLIVATSDWLEHEAFRRLYLKASERFLIFHSIDDFHQTDSLPPVPRLTIINPGHGAQPFPAEAFAVEGIDPPVNLFLISDDILEREGSDRRYIDIHSTIDLDQTIKRLNAWPF